MEEICKKYSISKSGNDLYCLNHLVKNIIKSKNPEGYIKKVSGKTFIKEEDLYYIGKDKFIGLIRSSKSVTAGEAIKLLDENLDDKIIGTVNNTFSNDKIMFDGIEMTAFNINGDLWIKGKDIATYLEYKNTEQAVDILNAKYKTRYADLQNLLPLEHRGRKPYAKDRKAHV